MHKRILMVYDGVLLELLNGYRGDCWFYIKGLCESCEDRHSELSTMCQSSRMFLGLNGWNWVEVAR